MPPFAAHLSGEAWIPLALLALGGTAVASLIALVVAFFSRPRARTWSVVTFVGAGGFFLSLLPMNGWNPLSAVGALIAVYPLTAVLGGAILLGLIARVIPLGSDPTVLQPRSKIRRNRWLVAGLLGVPTVAGAVAGVVWLADSSRGRQKTVALVAGDRDIRLTRMRWEYAQRRVICTDQEVLRYFEEQLRHTTDSSEAGGSYQLTLEYEGGGTDTVGSYWGKNGFELLLRGDGDFPSDYQHFRCPPPRPAGADEILKFLDAPVPEVRGRVLVVDANGTREESDPSLIAR